MSIDITSPQSQPEQPETTANGTEKRKRGPRKGSVRKGRKRTAKPVPETPEGGFASALTDLDPLKSGLPKRDTFKDPADFHSTASTYWRKLADWHDKKRDELVALGDASVRAAAVTADSKLDDAMSAIQALLASNPDLAAAMAAKLQAAQASMLQVG